jgi:hypothetical protein
MGNIFKFIVILGVAVIFSNGLLGQGSPGAYEFSTTINDSLSNPVRIAIDQLDNIYITDASQKQIKKYNAAGNFAGSIIAGGSPVSIAISEANEIFFGDGENGRVYKINNNGTITQLYEGSVFPSSMVFCSDGLLYVVDSKLKRIIVIDMNGGLVRTIGEGTLTYPTGITFDRKNNRILVTEHGGIGTGFNPVVKIRIYGLTGNLITSFGSHGNSDGKFYRIQGIAVGRCGEIYVPEPYQGNVSVFHENTLFATRFAQYGDSLGQLRIPLDIAINSQDQLFITAENNGTIEVFNIGYLLPTANITCGNKTICAGTSTQIPISLTGTPPWSFIYAINGASQDTITNISSSPYLLNASTPGNYQITAVADSSHAGTCFSGNAIITIDSVIPTATIITQNLTFCAGQTTAIPVNLTGTPPWEFTYTRNGLNPQTIHDVGNSPYLLNVQEAGSYSLTALSGKGCAGSSFSGTAEVTGHAKPTAEITGGNATICEGDTARFTVNLTGTAPWAVTMTNNDMNPETISNINENPFMMAVSQSGTYRIEEVQDALCSGPLTTGSFDVSVHPLPTAEISSGDATLCHGDSTMIIFDFTGTAPWNFTYTIDELNPVSVSGANETPYGLWVSHPGVYHLTAISDSTCSGTRVTGMATISENPLPVIDLGPEVTLCMGDSLVLDAGSGFTHYLWSDSSALRTLTVFSPGIYSVTVSDTLGCRNSATKTVTAAEIPAAVFTGGNSTVCKGETTDFPVTLTGTPPWSFTYTVNGANYRVVSDVTVNPYLLNVYEPGDYQIIEVTDALCNNKFPSGISTLTVNPLPTYNFSSGNGAICSGQSASLVVDLTGTPPWNFTYTLNGINPVTLNLVSANPAIIPVSQGGTYEITAISDAYCTGPARNGTATILEYPLPVVNLGTDVAIDPGKSLILDPGSSFAGYLWSDGTTGPTLAASNAGIYGVTVTDYNGCSNSDDIAVALLPIPVNNELQSMVVSGTECFSALQTITVAGNGTTFRVPDGGSATLIAGTSILFLPGSMVDSGGYLHGYIAIDSAYCGSAAPAMVSMMNAATSSSGLGENPEMAGVFKLYPNPSTGWVTIEIGNPAKKDLRIEIRDMAGRAVYSVVKNNPHIIEKMDLGSFPAGFYLVRLTSKEMCKVAKLVLVD